MLKKLEHLFLSVIFGRNYNRSTLQNTSGQLAQKQRLLGLLLLVTGIAIFCVALYNVIHGARIVAGFEFTIAFLCLILYILSHSNSSETKYTYWAVALLTLCNAVELYVEIFEMGNPFVRDLRFATLTGLFLPIIYMYFLKTRTGLNASLAFGLWEIICRYNGLIGGAEQWYHIRITCAYFMIATLVFLYTVVNNYMNARIANLIDNIRFERDRQYIMMDNLKTGVCTLNKDFVIQPNYSKSFKNIFNEPNLANTAFTDLFSDSITSKEAAGVKDFLQMVISQNHDKDILDDINPLSRTLYVNRNTKEEKNLSCAFGAITGNDGESLILVTVDDITTEIALQNEKAAEDEKRQSQINDILDIIQLDPAVLQDFIDDTDYEFNRINEMLKESKDNDPETTKYVLENLYLSIHAIKGDAVVLGLRRFSEQLHGFEDKIKELRGRADFNGVLIENNFENKIRNLKEAERPITFLDLLNITFDINRLMHTNDSLKEIIEKIHAFSSGSSRFGETSAFSKMMQQAADKVAAALGKEINFTSDIDETAIINGPRRVMKEMLMQLTRNAVYHGIENPETRMSAGKDSKGSISLSIKADEEKHSIRIDFEDDGMGLNLSGVKAKAKKEHLLPEDKLNNKQELINLLFSSSFSTASRADLYAGRGAGLALVKNLVSDLHGDLSVKFKEGAGTKFTIDIPFKENPVNVVVTEMS